MFHNINYGCIPLKGGPGIVCACTLKYLTGTGTQDAQYGFFTPADTNY